MNIYRQLAIMSLVSLIVVTGFFVFQQPALQKLFFKPCAQPMAYSLGEFDRNFRITPEQFLADVEQAAQVWDQSIDKNLFRYSESGKLKINLVYDARQQTTEQLKSIGIKIENTESSYKNLKSRYESMVADYQRQKAAYESQVHYWNSRGGVPENEYNKLQAQQAALNQLIDEVNALAKALNNLARQLNLNVATYNTVGSSRGSEFEEGTYVSDADGERIDIYEFNDEPQLVRLLAHELGHALGLEHVDDPEAIMYRLNQETNIVPTSADVIELKRVCGLE